MFDSFMPTKKELRPHQQEAIDGLWEAARQGYKRIVLQAPTGFGKTLTAAKIIERALAKGRKVLFTVPRLTLVDQALNDFENEGLSHLGVIQQKHPRTDLSAPVQIASVQTLIKRTATVRQADLVIIDECHEDFEGLTKIMTGWKGSLFIGLSATPWRVGMGLQWQTLVQAATIGDLIGKGFLSKFTVFAPDVPDLSGVEVRRGDYVESGLEAIMGEAKLVGNVVHTWLSKGENRPTLVFGVNRAHARNMADRFIAAGVSAAYVDCETDSVERQSIARKFKAGEFKVACSVRTLTTGIDWPVSCIVDAAPTKSEMLHVQKCGRGLRVNTGTEDCVAAGSMVLTDTGLCEIQRITLDHKVWDGVAFVSHGGAVCRGVRPVLTHDGLTATPDHLVMTIEGWVAHGEAADRRLRIVRTGIGRKPIRFSDDFVTQDNREAGQVTGGGCVRPVRKFAHGVVSQHSEAARNQGLPSMQWAEASNGSEVAVCEMPSAAVSLQKSEKYKVRELWGSGNRVQVRECKFCGSLDCRKFGDCEQKITDRPDRQQWSLRTGESEVGKWCHSDREQQSVKGLSRTVFGISPDISRNQVFGQVASKSDQLQSNERTNCGTVQTGAVQELVAEVWDILNAGPLRRFTVNGRLVHNCVFLDHAGNALRLGLVTDIHHADLDRTLKGQKPKQNKVKLPKPCSACEVLYTGQACPACGEPRKIPTGYVETADGELVPIGSVEKRIQVTGHSKQQFWSMALWVDADRGKGGRMAKGLFKGKFGVWPKGLIDQPRRPDQAFLNYERSSRIAYAKRMEKQRGLNSGNVESTDNRSGQGQVAGNID